MNILEKIANFFGIVSEKPEEKQQVKPEILKYWINDIVKIFPNNPEKFPNNFGKITRIHSFNLEDHTSWQIAYLVEFEYTCHKTLQTKSSCGWFSEKELQTYE